MWDRSPELPSKSSLQPSRSTSEPPRRSLEPTRMSLEPPSRSFQSTNRSLKSQRGTYDTNRDLKPLRAHLLLTGEHDMGSKKICSDAQPLNYFVRWSFYLNMPKELVLLKCISLTIQYPRWQNCHFWQFCMKFCVSDITKVTEVSLSKNIGVLANLW